MDSAFNFPREGGPEEEKKEANLLNLRGVKCPLNYVKTKLYLENLPKDSVIDIYLDEGEPIAHVPRSLENDGQTVLKIEKLDGFYKVTVKKVTSNK